MHPQIAALFQLQKEDHRLTQLERQLAEIPQRITEIDADIGRLEALLQAERRKTGETLDFKKAQEDQLHDEEDQIRRTKTKMSQVTTTRELGATQRELETTRRMASSRSDEIAKLATAVGAAQERITSLETGLDQLRSKADAEKQRLIGSRAELESGIARLRTHRTGLTGKLDAETLRKYERIRKRYGGSAFVAAMRERCSACKMQIPAVTYVVLRKGETIETCESCGRLLYFGTLFAKDGEADAAAAAPKAKAAPRPRERKPAE